MIGMSYAQGPDTPPVIDLTVGDALRDAAAESPNHIALVEGIAEDRRRWTYAELLGDAEACARALRARYQPGSKVAVWAPNTPEFSVFQFGAALAGMVLVTINPTFREPEFRFSIEQSGARACLVYPEFRGSPMGQIARRVREEVTTLGEIIDVAEFPAFLQSADSSVRLPDVDPLSPAQIQYTSGTTGIPKGALIPHRAIVNDPRQAATSAGGRIGDVWMGVLPLFHVGGCVLAAMGALSLRGTFVPLLNFDAGLALRLIEEEHVTITNPVPTMLVAMMQHPEFALKNLSSLRTIISGGAVVPPTMIRSIEEALGVDFVVVFGQTETTGVITMTTTADTVDDKAFTVGRPLPGVEVQIASADTGDMLPTGEIGEILTRGYHTMVGYHHNPTATTDARGPEGWLRTGDLGVMDERGYLKISGRSKDMIIRGGENLFPREIEDVLYEHPALTSAAVVGVPDDYYGEIPIAFVSFADGRVADGDELTVYLRSRLSGYKIPAKWYHVTEYPSTLSGKIQKFVLRDRWINGEYEGSEL